MHENAPGTGTTVAPTGSRQLIEEGLEALADNSTASPANPRLGHTQVALSIASQGMKHFAITLRIHRLSSWSPGEELICMNEVGLATSTGVSNS